jgi:hypothetical protein
VLACLLITNHAVLPSDHEPCWPALCSRAVLACLLLTCDVRTAASSQRSCASIATFHDLLARELDCVTIVPSSHIPTSHHLTDMAASAAARAKANRANGAAAEVHNDTPKSAAQPPSAFTNKGGVIGFIKRGGKAGGPQARSKTAEGRKADAAAKKAAADAERDARLRHGSPPQAVAQRVVTPEQLQATSAISFAPGAAPSSSAAAPTPSGTQPGPTSAAAATGSQQQQQQQYASLAGSLGEELMRESNNQFVTPKRKGSNAGSDGTSSSGQGIGPAYSQMGGAVPPPPLLPWRTRLRILATTVVHDLQHYAIPLLTGILVALVWANLDPESYDTFVFGYWTETLFLEHHINLVTPQPPHTFTLTLTLTSNTASAW